MINHIHKILLFLSIWSVNLAISAQESLILGGGFQTNANLFIRDSSIGAANIPQYDHQLFGAESWLDINASYQGFNAGIRFDLFNNSNLLDPKQSYTDQGIGRWFINKQVDRFDITAGYIYDQIGSGIIYRAYEERAQLIDNALVGISCKFNFNNNWSLKGFTGKQKNLFEQYNSIIKGVSLNGFYKPTDTSSWSIAPGFGFVNRTIGDQVVQDLVTILSGYLPVDQVTPNYNTNAISVFNTLTYRDFSWYVEAAYKPDDLYYDPTAVRSLGKGNTDLGKYVKQDGSVFYTSIGYAAHNLGITIEGKRTEAFDFRAEPTLTLNKGLITFIPPSSKINTYRLNSYYYPATQYLSEMAYQIDLKYGFGDHWNFSVNFSDIRDKDFTKEFYKEIYAEVLYKKPGSWQLSGGLQHQRFNQEVYYGKGGQPTIKTITPFAEFLYKFSRKNSIRVEAQYMDNKEDIGSWVNGLVELGFSPHWLIEVSDMYNVKPTHDKKAIHYPAFGIVYNYGSNRFGIKYVKQLEGIVCSGGICRLEPAFSGIRASITSSF
ncbi:MAG: hypothetical protein IPG55_16040 [Saprospiraceae bacterium]|nr:hypothetical protein [Candidatus Defluviibacterium haderslevense]